MEGGDDTSCKKMSSVRVTPPDQTEVKLFFSSLLCPFSPEEASRAIINKKINGQPHGVLLRLLLLSGGSELAVFHLF